jgi:hypothetical protein
VKSKNKAETVRDEREQIDRDYRDRDKEIEIKMPEVNRVGVKR